MTRCPARRSKWASFQFAKAGAALCVLVGALAPKAQASEPAWKHTYAVPSQMQFQVRKIVGTSDGGYALVADGIVLYKLSAIGALQWQAEIRSAPATLGNRNKANDILQTTDGELLVVGSSDSDSIAGRDMSRPFGDKLRGSRDRVPLIAKFSSEGRELWRRVLAKARPDYLFGDADQAVEISGGYLVLGRHLVVREKKPDLPNPRKETFLAKLSANGDVQWERSFGDIPHFDPSGYRLLKLGSDRFAITGYATLPLRSKSDGTPDFNSWDSKTEGAHHTIFLVVDSKGNEVFRSRLDGLFQAALATERSAHVLMKAPVWAPTGNSPPSGGRFLLSELNGERVTRPACDGIGDLVVVGMTLNKETGNFLSHGHYYRQVPFSISRPYPVLMEVTADGTCRIRRHYADLDMELRSLVPATDSRGWVGLFMHLAKNNIFWIEKFELYR